MTILPCGAEIPVGYPTLKKTWGLWGQPSLGLKPQNRPEMSVTHQRLCAILISAHLGRLGGVLALAEIRVQEGEPLENALRRFKRKVQTEDIIKEVKRHSFYLKPGEKKRVKEALARKRNRKKIRKEQD
jgi:small subunit ribosomal protein S21